MSSISDWVYSRGMFALVLLSTIELGMAHVSSAQKLDPYNPSDMDEVKQFASRPREYTLSGVGLIGGTSWIYGYNIPPGPKREKLRIEQNTNLRRMLDITSSQLINTDQYNFIIGLGMQYEPLWDLLTRVIRDQWTEGRFSTEQPLYAALKNRAFSRLDCHSNGAMLCLAAIKLNDVKAEHVRLFGPQITPESLRQWNSLLASGKIKSIQVYINRGDPVPALSYLLGAGKPMDWIYGLLSEITNAAPSILTTITPCPDGKGLIDVACHDMKLYKKNVSPPPASLLAEASLTSTPETPQSRDLTPPAASPGLIVR